MKYFEKIIGSSKRGRSNLGRVGDKGGRKSLHDTLQRGLGPGQWRDLRPPARQIPHQDLGLGHRTGKWRAGRGSFSHSFFLLSLVTRGCQLCLVTRGP